MSAKVKNLVSLKYGKLTVLQNSCYKRNTIKGEHLFEEEMTLVVQTLKSFRGC